MTTSPVATSTGLIPARAGNTGGGCRQGGGPRAHPRSRGEHFSGAGSDACAGGSSPLARGTPAGILLDLRMMGLIPARAGNTLCI